MSRAERNRYGIVSSKAAQVRMELIRKENVKRHNDVAAKRTLRDSQIRAQRVRTMQAELDRLHASVIHGNGLDAVRFNRMNTLKEVLGSNK
jgi:hypothetical protein